MQFATILRSARIALAVILLGSFLSLEALSQHEPRLPGELIIRLAPEATIEDVLSDPALADYGLVPIRNLVPLLNIWLVGFDEEGLAQSGVLADNVLANTRSASSIRLAQYNHVVEHRGAIEEPYGVLEAMHSTTPNDPLFGQMWGLNNTGQTGGTPGADIDALAAWEITTGGIASNGEQIVVAIVDSGFDLNHPDINFWKNVHESSTPNGQDSDGNGYIDDYHGWNAFSNSGVITSSQHGTHVSGTAAARGNNSLGVTGVNWDAAVMPIQGSSGNEAIVVAAYGYVLTMRTIYNDTGGAQGAFVVSTNASFGVDFGNPANFPIWCGMYDELGQVGIISTGATMNINANVDTQGDVPTACPSNWLISVTNTTNNDQKNSGAAYGLTTIELGAPGTGILSTNPNGNYGTSTGTSMATPHVTGAIATVVSSMSPGRLAQYMAAPAEVALQIRQAILDGTDFIGIQTVTGGRLNLHRALLEAMKYDVPDLPEVAGGTTRAAAFDGTSGLVAGPSFRFPRSDDAALSMWAQIDGPGVLAELASDETLAFRLEVIENGDNLVLRYAHHDDEGVEVSRTFTQRPLTGSLHHIAFSRGDEIPAVRLFVDGSRVGQPFFYTREPHATGQEQFFVGNDASGENGISAVVDEVRLFRDRVLLQDLQQWMHASIPLDELPPSLVAYYRFEADTTGFAWDFSNSGNGGDITNHVDVTSPFPVGAQAAMITSSAIPSATIGPEDASLSATITASLSGGAYLALYMDEVSDELVHDETFPDGVLARANTVWGTYASGNVTADLIIAANDVIVHDGSNVAILYRADRNSEWEDVSGSWTIGTDAFSIAGAEAFGEFAVGYTYFVGTETATAPAVAALSAAFPNPFQANASLTLDMPEPGVVKIEVLDVLGRRVVVLHDGPMAADSHQVTVEGSRLVPGTYFVRVIGEGFSAVQRLTLVR